MTDRRANKGMGPTAQKACSGSCPDRQTDNKQRGNATDWPKSMHTKETCVQKYAECKLSKNGGIPEYREFLQYSGIDRRQLSRVFGASTYSKLQIAAGDAPNKLQMERTPLAPR